MRFTKVEKRKDELLHQKPSLYYFCKEFLDANIEVAQVEWIGEYKNANSCFSSLNAVVNKHNFPIKVTVRSHEVYLINTQYNG